MELGSILHLSGGRIVRNPSADNLYNYNYTKQGGSTSCLISHETPPKRIKRFMRLDIPDSGEDIRNPDPPTTTTTTMVTF